MDAITLACTVLGVTREALSRADIRDEIELRLAVITGRIKRVAGVGPVKLRRLGNALAYPPLVVTRHVALVEYMREIGLVPPTHEHQEHVAHRDQVLCRRVYGVLPLRLACWCWEVVEVPLEIPPELRGKELDLDTVRRLAGPAERYVVRCLGSPDAVALW